MNPYIEILRIANVILACITIVLIALISHDYSLAMLLTTICVFLAMGGGNVINDYFDYKIDLINRPDRPIPSGRISLKNGLYYAYGLFASAMIVSVILSYLIQSIWPGTIVILACIIMYFYGSTLKSTVLIGNITVALLTGVCFIFAGVVSGVDTNSITIIYTSVFLGFFAVLMTTAREIIKDMEDIEGDKKEGVVTFPIKYGLKKSSYIAIPLIVIDCILCPLLYIYNVFSINYLYIIIIAIIMFVYAALKIMKDQTKENCKVASKLTKFGMLVAFIAFVIGSF